MLTMRSRERAWCLFQSLSSLVAMNLSAPRAMASDLLVDVREIAVRLSAPKALA